MTSLNPHLVPRTPESDDPPQRLSAPVRSLHLPEATPAARLGGRLLVWLCLALALSTAGLGYLLWKEKQASHTTAATPETASSPNASVTTATEVASSGEIVLQSKGYIIPARQILVSPKVSGMIETLNAQEGMVVQKGQILAVLESTDYKADVDHAAAVLESSRRRLEELERGFRPEEISQSRAELAESEAQRVQADADSRRAQELRRKNVISSEEYDASESRFESTSRRVDRLRFAVKLMEDGPRIERIQIARADVQLAEADLAKAQWRLGNCVIRAPISGTILKKNAEEGNIVNPIAFNGSFSLCEMADLADLEVDLTIQERDIARIFQGQQCTVRAEAFAERDYQGWVSRLMPIANRAKGAIPVRVKVQVPAGEQGVYLKPEMGAVVSFSKDKSPQATAPITSLPAEPVPAASNP